MGVSRRKTEVGPAVTAGASGRGARVQIRSTLAPALAVLRATGAGTAVP